MNENIIKEYESRKSLAVKIEATESLQERNKLKQEYRKLFNNINYLDRKTLQKRKRKGEKIENNDNYDTMEKIDDILKQINLKQEHTIEVDEKYNNNNEKSYQYPYEKEKNPIKRILQAGLYWTIKHPFLTAMAITGKLLPKTNAVKQSKQINDVQTIYNDFVQKHPNADFNDEFCLNDFLQDHFNNINDYLKNHNILLLTTNNGSAMMKRQQVDGRSVLFISTSENNVFFFDVKEQRIIVGNKHGDLLNYGASKAKKGKKFITDVIKGNYGYQYFPNENACDKKSNPIMEGPAYINTNGMHIEGDCKVYDPNGNIIRNKCLAGHVNNDNIVLHDDTIVFTVNLVDKNTCLPFSTKQYYNAPFNSVDETMLNYDRTGEIGETTLKNKKAIQDYIINDYNNNFLPALQDGIQKKKIKILKINISEHRNENGLFHFKNFGPKDMAPILDKSIEYAKKYNIDTLYLEECSCYYSEDYKNIMAEKIKKHNYSGNVIIKRNKEHEQPLTVLKEVQNFNNKKKIMENNFFTSQEFVLIKNNNGEIIEEIISEPLARIIMGGTYLNNVKYLPDKELILCAKEILKSENNDYLKNLKYLPDKIVKTAKDELEQEKRQMEQEMNNCDPDIDLDCDKKDNELDGVDDL